MKKRLLFLSLLFILLYINIKTTTAQTLDWVRTGTVAQQGVMIARDANDNVLSCGYTVNDRQFTRKWDKLGNLLWERESATGVNTIFEQPSWISTDASGNIITLGYSYIYSGGRQNPTAIVILKYSPNGRLLFKKTIEGVFAVTLRSELDAAGNIYIAAAGSITGQTENGFNVIKLNPDGNVLWTTVHNFGSVHAVYNMRYRNGFVALTGTTALYGGNCSTAMFDETGKFLWAATTTSGAGRDVEIDNAGNVYAVNTDYASGYDDDIKVTKYSVTGAVLFTFIYDNNGHYETPRRINLQPDGNLVVSGISSTVATGFVSFKLSAAGSLIWDRFFITNDIPESYFAATNSVNGDFIITGTTSITGSPAAVITINYDLNGNEKWNALYDSTSSRGMGLAVANDGTVYVVGRNIWTILHYLQNSIPVTCPAVFSLTAASITSNAATVNWGAASNANSYDADYKQASSATWLNAATGTTNTFVNLSGLNASTAYDWRVRANCATSISNYSTSGFTTSAASIACPGPYDVSTNNTTGGASLIPLNTNILGTVSIKNDNDYYRFSIVSGGTISLTLANLPANYQLSLLNSSGSQLAISQKNGTSSEAITNYTVAAGTYFARVFPKGNVFNASSCYLLSVQTGTAFKLTQYLPNQSLGISIFPNPVNSELKITINPIAEQLTIDLLDIYGRKIMYKTATQSTGINMSKLAAGIYILRMTTKQGRVLYQEIIIKK